MNSNHNDEGRPVNEAAIRGRARKMTDAVLAWNAKDAAEAALAADELERAGCRVDKTGGYYRDEAAIYRAEIARRANRPADRSPLKNTGPLREYEPEDLPALGWIRILEVGEENIYFAVEGNATRGFCKIAG